MIRSVLVPAIRHSNTSSMGGRMMNTAVPMTAATRTAARTGGRGGGNRMMASNAAKPQQHQATTHSPLEADTGRFGTHQHHHLTTFLLLVSPVYALAPLDDFGSGQAVRKMVDGVLACTITVHSWVGLNYVASDYVPKISRSLLGPARVVNAALAVTTLAGLLSIALNDKGGIKACVKGLWTNNKKKTLE